LKKRRGVTPIKHAKRLLVAAGKKIPGETAILQLGKILGDDLHIY